MRPASATDTVETDTHSADLSIGVIEARSAAARPPFDGRRKPTPPSWAELTDAWRASRHPMRSRVGARLSLGFWQTETRRACAPPMPCAGVVFPSHDREADPRDVPVAVRSMRPHCFSPCLRGSGVVDRSAETAAFHPTREGRTTRSIRDVFHRTISPERRFVAEDALDADAPFPRPCDHETARRIPHLAPRGSTPACADPDWVPVVPAPDASQRRDAACSPLRVSTRGGWPRSRDLAAAILGPTSVRFGGFGPFRYPVDAALRFPSALHVPASTSSFDFYQHFERGH